MEPNNKPIDSSNQTTAYSERQAVEPDRQMENMRRALKKNLSRQIQFMLNSCVNCGLCAESCHYYCSTGDSELIPVNKFEKLSNLLQTYFHPVRSRFSFLKKSDYPDEEIISGLFKAAYEDCTLCGKCALTCPMGINTGEILTLARAMLCSIGRLPSGLVHPVETAFKVGNYLGLSTEDFVENLCEWLWVCIYSDYVISPHSYPDSETWPDGVRSRIRRDYEVSYLGIDNILCTSRYYRGDFIPILSD